MDHSKLSHETTNTSKREQIRDILLEVVCVKSRVWCSYRSGEQREYPALLYPAYES